MLNYQTDKQKLILDLLNERTKLTSSNIDMLLDSYDEKDTINHVIKKFGINDEHPGTEYIIDMIKDTYLEFQSKTKTELIKEKLYDRKSSLYQVIAHDYSTEQNKLDLESVNSAINNSFSKRNKIMHELGNSEYIKIFGGRKNISLTTFVYLIAKHMYENKMLEKERVFKL